ncbi:hypothetical protein BX600DRAFT_89092 [Xylariales sp. PMI_506]|nr:hypothetical protein BX600DRAFT_89092 [Xylariales sp. PMI_506]
MIPDTPSTSLPSSLPDPRKRPSSSSPEAPEPKKRKSTHERAPVNSSGEFWEIKDICDERINQGVLEYLVEWKDINPRTGRPYKPSWEPSVNVTDDAIEVWQSRNGAVLPGSQSDVNSSQLFSLSQSSEAALRQDSAGVGTSILDAELEEDDITLLGQRQQERRRLRRHQYVVLDSQDLDSQDLVRQGQTPGQLLSGFSPELQEERRRDLVVELPQDIALDAAEYRHIRSSQLQSSQSQDYQGDVSFPSQDGSLHFQSSSLQELSSLPAALSNKTIPDSQDLSGYDLSEAADSGPQQALALSVVHSQHQEISPISTGGQPKSSAQSPDKDSGSQSDIPSHQPEQGGLDCLNPGYAEPLTHPLRSQLIPGSPTITTQNSTLQFRRAFAAHSQDVVGFLSQIPFELDDLSSSLQPSQKSSAKHSAEIYLSQVQLSSDLGPTSQASPQAAQVLPQSINHSEGIQSLNRSGAEFHVHNDELVIVPETVRKHRNSHLAHQEQSPALSELDGNSRTSSYNSRDRAAGLQVEHTSICSPQIPINRSSDEQAVRQLEDKTVSSPLQSQLNDPPQPQDGSPIIRPSSPQVTTPTPSMDDQLTTSTPLSARERLRRIREETYGSLMSPSQAPAPPVQAIETNDTPANSEQPAHLEQVDQAEQAREPAVPEQPEQLEPAEEPDQPALPEQLDFSVPILAPYLLEPSIVTGPQDDAGPDFGSKSDGPLPLEQPVFDSGTLDASYGPPPEEQPATLDPSALTLSIENDVPESPSIPTDDGVAPDGHPTDSVDEPEEADHAVSNEEHGEYFEGDLLPYIPSGANEYLLTLPLASNIRPQYIQIIQETSRDLAAYNSALAESRTPEPSLVAKVDRMFTRLFDICDLPPFLETLPSISPQSITKHIRQTNSKFAFVAQFLEYLGRLESEKKILILARPGQVIDLLNNIVETEGYRHIRLADGVVHCSWEQQHQLTVTVASTSESLSPLPSDFDVIIAFDHTFRQEQLKPRHVDNPPLLLALVTATSIEHLNMRISDKIELLERKNVLLLALCASLRVMEYPEPGFPQAHEMARDFANFAENPDDDDFYWTPQSIPESIFANIAASSQEVIPSNVITGEPGDRSSRKRSLPKSCPRSARGWSNPGLSQLIARG